MNISEARSQCQSFADQAKPINEQIPTGISRSQFKRTNCTNYDSITVDSWKTARTETFVGWPHINPSKQSMIDAGWFYCKVKDRVICLYCDTICHQWIEDDDPLEVHQRFGKNCHFLKSINAQKEFPMKSSQTTSANQETLRLSYPSMREVTRRINTFQNINSEEIKIDSESLAIAGFFYSGIQSSVTCFCCGGSLSTWSRDDNPIFEHVRWFPHCIYAKMLCEPKLSSKIQLIHQETIRTKTEIENLPRLINARLDLPIVEQLRKEFSMPIIKRCIHDQLVFGKDDFPSDSAFYFACQILKKQIEVIDGNRDILIVPSKNINQLSLSSTPCKKQTECVVCMERERQIAAIPCGHFSTCTVCAFGLEKCPVCRQNTNIYVRIYPV